MTWLLLVLAGYGLLIVAAALNSRKDQPWQHNRSN
jgi:hypothetical protein